MKGIGNLPAMTGLAMNRVLVRPVPFAETDSNFFGTFQIEIRQEGVVVFHLLI